MRGLKSEEEVPAPVRFASRIPRGAWIKTGYCALKEEI